MKTMHLGVVYRSQMVFGLISGESILLFVSSLSLEKGRKKRAVEEGAAKNFNRCGCLRQLAEGDFQLGFPYGREWLA